MVMFVNRISIYTLCLIIAEITAGTESISTDISCKLLEPPAFVEGRDEEYLHRIEVYYDDDNLVPSFVESHDLFNIWGKNGKLFSLDEQFVKVMKDARSRSMYWRQKIAQEPALMLIFTTEQYLSENLHNNDYYIPLGVNVDSKIHGFYIITENKIETIENCGNESTPPEFHSLVDVLEYCGYTYNACYCDKYGNQLSEERCGDRSNCHAGLDREDGYICHKCNSAYWAGDHCDKSIMFIGLISILIISLTSLCGAIFAPFQKSPYYPDVQGCMIAVAVGCLTGDAVLHLIPIIFGLHGHSHGKAHEDEPETKPSMAPETIIQRGLTMMAGLYFFYLFETLINLYRQHRERKTDTNKPNLDVCGTTTGHHVAMLDKCQKDSCLDNRADTEDVDEKSGKELLMHGHSHEGHGHSHATDGIAMVGWMVILGDGLHNFADGLAIAASFSASYTIGLGTVLAVFFHELPHELGDFAVLLGSGMTVYQAMFWNLMSAFTCFFGFFAGMALSDTEEIGNFILGIAAGAFCYIALVDMLPEIKIQKSTAHPFRRFAFHQVGLLSGALIMWLIAKYEENLIHYFA